MGYELILLAAGQGRRMQASKNKVLIHLQGRPVIDYALATFVEDENCQHIILVVEQSEQELIEATVKKNRFSEHKAISFVVGGVERQDSVYNGLQKLENKTGIVMIHDGARPFVEIEAIQSLYQAAKQRDAAILGVPVKDTIKKVSNGKVIETVPRELLWKVQTPQAFEAALIKQVHENAKIEGFFGTDDASLVEHYGQPVYLVPSSDENIKLTTPADLLIGEAILTRRNELLQLSKEEKR